MGFFESNFGKKQADSASPPAAAEPPQRARAAPVGAAAAPAPGSPPTEGKGPEDTPGKPGFLKSAFGNPEAGELYGTGNDYETEEQQIKDEKVSANQSIWYFGAFALLLLLGYLFFK